MKKVKEVIAKSNIVCRIEMQNNSLEAQNINRLRGQCDIMKTCLEVQILM